MEENTTPSPTITENTEPHYELGDNRVWLGEDGKLVIDAAGAQDFNNTMAIVVAMKELVARLQAEGKPILVLNFIFKETTVSSEARKVAADFSRSLPVDRYAIVGGPGVITKYTQNLMLKAVGMNNFHYFDNEDDARKWLDEFEPKASQV